MIRKDISKIQICLFLQLTILSICIYSYPAQAEETKAKPQLSLSGDLYFVNNPKNNMWIKTRSKRVDSVDDVQQHLSTLNKGEFNDWRLPTKRELYNLFSIFDMKKNGKVKIRIEGSYWLVNNTGKVIAGAWEIGDGCGPERIFYPSKEAHIMAIRP